MKGLEIRMNGGEPVRIGSQDGLLLFMLCHLDKEQRKGSDAIATLKEYDTGDRYNFIAEDLKCGDEFEIRFTDFEEQSAPVALAKKGEKPLKRPMSKEERLRQMEEKLKRRGLL